MSSEVLNIEIHPDYFAYALKSSAGRPISHADIEYNSGQATESVQIELLSQWLKKHQGVWNSSYQSIHISMHGFPFTVSPDMEGGMFLLKENILTETTTDEYHFDSLSNNFGIVFFIPAKIENIFKNYFENPIFHHSCIGICHFLINQKQSSQLNLHITPSEGFFFYSKKGLPVYFNSFKYKNEDDLLYYSLLVYEKLGLSSDSFPITLSGMVEKHSEIYQMLYQYIRNIEILNFQFNIENYNDKIVKPNYLANLIYLES